VALPPPGSEGYPQQVYDLRFQTSDAATDPPPALPARTYLRGGGYPGGAPKARAKVKVGEEQKGERRCSTVTGVTGWRPRHIHMHHQEQRQSGEGKENARQPPASPGNSGVEWYLSGHRARKEGNLGYVRLAE